MLPRLALVCAFTLLLPAPALGATYTVAGFGDESVPAACDGLVCPTLRAAVQVANASPDPDAIALGAGEYTLSQGPLTFETPVDLSGAGARATTVRMTAVSQLLHVITGVQANVSALTLAGGNGSDGTGGNISNQGALTVSDARITGGAAVQGAGIANLGGTLTVTRSLIDANNANLFGGGILNQGNSGGPEFAATATIRDSTITGNSASSGGGVAARTNSANVTQLIHVTLARNTGGGGLFLEDSQTASAYGSILASNATVNCLGSGPPRNDGYNLESGTDCAFAGSGSRQATDPLLSDGLVDAGGPTDVFSLPESSPAAGLVADCQSASDQRGVARPASALEPCDAGAFEYVAPAPPPPPQPTPTPAPPAPTPTPEPVATPVPQKSVAGETVSGKVLVRAPGGKGFVELDPADPIPLGSTVDVKQGVIELAAIVKKGAKLQKARFYDGIFKVTQTKKTTDLTLNEPLASCSKRARAAAKKPKSRKLWGDGSGSFRTRGQYSSATVRGTRWLVQDSCAGTLTEVKKGAVSVHDDVKRKTIILRAGKNYLAKPRH